VWVPGFENSDDPIALGDLIVEEIAFTADNGSGRTSKRRPCVVVGIDADTLRFRAIHSTGGAVHRGGLGITLKDWELAGLSKRSVVNPDIHVRSITRPLAPSRRVGRLSARDAARVLGVNPQD
jgi:hypothetical protein